ncbi:laccase-4 [Cajanus cajan]|uniref:Laccase n=1 Tax=Cajanus cajan TaxID=3821 RepID=A0A151S1M1_CAJCA|nr:laccase-4 [Cajanus cajan]KYP48713.1 Laccase-4 [Cajanus cajan]
MEPRLLAIFLVALSFSPFVHSLVRHYKFSVVLKNTTKLCSTKSFVTINGQFPGPTLYAREDDTVIVRVTNHVKYNITIHWHGIRQLRSGWSDGPAYVTQCPIQPGQNFVYNFTITGQRGTLLWHAHITWLRATVYGAIVILPKRGISYPFPKPDKEKIIILGEWWKSDVEAVLNQAENSGLPPNISDAHTINGHTGPVRGCNSQGYTLHVESGKTYLLRIINAALNDELFFKIAGHRLTVVEADASYVKPFEIDTIFMSPGQTTNVLLTANQGVGKYLIAVTPFMDAPIGFDNVTSIATLRYKTTPPYPKITLTTIPALNATPLTTDFIDFLRSLNSKEYPARVPLAVDHSLFFAITVGLNPCDMCLTGTKLVSAINNITFLLPTISSLLEAHYYNIKGVFTDDFPAFPPIVFNYTGTQPANIRTNNGTRVYRLNFNSTVQIILQGTAMIAPENHPFHLHGYNFFVVGQGLGNFDPEKDPLSFNLVDPVERNTIGVPNGGWAAIRFRANNPGVWFLHCHLEVHTTWGLKMAFIVDNGNGPHESSFPPPKDLPKC